MKIQFEQLIDDSYRVREKEQENLLLSTLSDILDIGAAIKTKNILKDDSSFFQNIRELKQEKSILNETIQLQDAVHQKTNRNFYFVIGFLSVLVAIVLSSVIFNIEDKEPNIFSSSFLIQNLRGDTIDTWIAWKIVEGDAFHVHVKNSKYATDERLEVISETIMSEQSIELDDSLLHTGQPGSISTFYLGWSGALNSISEETESPIPKNLHFHVTDKGEGDVIIGLTSLSNSDGYAGFTKAIIDEQNHQILKSTITIYDIENLSSSQLSTIARHELGHAFGLAHSTATEDLMYPTIETNYPYISDCDLDAITLLYDGGQSSQVICEK